MGNSKIIMSPKHIELGEGVFDKGKSPVWNQDAKRFVLPEYVSASVYRFNCSYAEEIETTDLEYVNAETPFLDLANYEQTLAFDFKIYTFNSTNISDSMIEEGFLTIPWDTSTKIWGDPLVKFTEIKFVAPKLDVEYQYRIDDGFKLYLSVTNNSSTPVCSRAYLTKVFS